MAKAKQATQQEQNVRFEDAMERLSSIVDRLEAGEGSLDEMLKLYEEGMSLVKGCETQLDAYDAAITKLTNTEEGEHGDA